ncbi:trypsin-like peptidase domain-containing protein [Humisphaera borealis]|nr:trypsin-like peptidase domain-containing protein [Humisphaera borealis]
MTTLTTSKNAPTTMRLSAQLARRWLRAAVVASALMSVAVPVVMADERTIDTPTADQWSQVDRVMADKVKLRDDLYLIIGSLTAQLSPNHPQVASRQRQLDEVRKEIEKLQTTLQSTYRIQREGDGSLKLVALADAAAPEKPKKKAKKNPAAAAVAPDVKPDPYPSATPQKVVAVTDKIFPAVVRLDVAQEIYSDGKRNLQRGIGSGVIIDGEGRILTNYHVAGRGVEIYVTLANKERVKGKLIGDDHWTDLAIVQLDKDELKKKNITYKFAELGTSKQLIPGQDVMAVGTPFGLARTMTLGVVSNNERTFYPDRLTIDEFETGWFANWIQMDTPINPGNSGGPLVDMDGYVVGINTRGGGQNLNFAVPIDTAKYVVEKILETSKDGKKGYVPRSDLGVDLKPLQDLETFYDIDINKGVLINSVDRNSPASKAGIKSQDILLEIDGKSVNCRFPEEIAPVRRMIADITIGKEVTLTLKRGKENLTVKAKTEKLEGAVGQERELKTWGLSIRDVTRAYANQRLLDDDKGVVVTTLSPGYPAAKAELSPGDVVRAVNGEEVNDIDALQKLFDESVKNKDDQVLFNVQRGRGQRTVILKVTY